MEAVKDNSEKHEGFVVTLTFMYHVKVILTLVETIDYCGNVHISIPSSSNVFKEFLENLKHSLQKFYKI